MNGPEDEIADLLKGTRRDERPPERVWEALAKRLDAGPPAAPSAAPAASVAVLPLACATCSGALVDGAAVYCASCLAPHHAECFTACTVHGCQGTRFVTAQAPRRSFAAPLVLLGAAAIGSIFFVQRAYDELLEETRRSAQLENDIKKFIIVQKPAPPAAIPERIDVSVEDEPLSVVLDRIGQQAHKNIVADPAVGREKVRVQLRDVHWRDAVSVIASFVKCDLIERDSVLVVAKPIVPPAPETIVRAVDGPKATTPEEGPAAPELKVKAIVDGARAHQNSTAIINDRIYREGDELVGKDGKPFSPRLFVSKIRSGEVEIATGSRDGARTVLGIGH